MNQILTIIVSFHQSQSHDFKTYYTQFVCCHLTGDLLDWVRYTRTSKLMQSTLFPPLFLSD